MITPTSLALFEHGSRRRCFQLKNANFCAGIFKGQLTANLPNGNSTEGDLDGFALARSCETLLDLTSLGGLEIAVRSI